MKQQQAKETGKILSAIYKTLDSSDSAQLLSFIAKLDNILHSNITYYMTDNFSPTTSNPSLKQLDIMPCIGEIVYYLYNNKYKKCVILHVANWIDNCYVCGVKILKTNEKHYVDTYDLYYKNPAEERDND